MEGCQLAQEQELCGRKGQWCHFQIQSPQGVGRLALLAASAHRLEEVLCTGSAQPASTGGVSHSCEPFLSVSLKPMHHI